MKKIVAMLLLLCFSQFSVANDTDKSLFIQAKALIKSENFTAAIPLLKQYVKDLDKEALKEVYLELANAYYSLNNENETLRNIKLAISKGGLTEEGFIYSKVLHVKTSQFAWQYFYENFDKLRNKAIAY